MDDSVFSWHEGCYTAFRTLQETLSTNRVYEEQLSKEAVNDLFGRFNIWAGNIGAGRQGRASLDYRLREVSEIKGEVVSILQYLANSLQEATSIVSGSRLPYDQLPSGSDSSVSSLSEDGEHENRELQNVVGVPPGTELQELHHSITSFLSNLYRMSTIIRKNPAPYDRLVRSAKIDTESYEFFDERHVREKYPLADSVLVKRLGVAISKRRKYFIYREQHRQKISRQQAAEKTPTVGKNKHAVVDLNQGVPVAETPFATSVVRTPTLLQPSATIEPMKASTFYAHDNPTVNIQAFDLYSEAGTQTSFGSTSSIQQEEVALPPLPKSAREAGEFECPYCCTICCLKASDPQRRNREWKRHVLRDLQPYICTFGGCSKAHTLFERRRDWMGHELQVHRLEWCCNVPGHEAYSTRDEFWAHMKHEHDKFFGFEQLDSTINMFARPALQSSFSCPICVDDRYHGLSIDKLEEHLGRHLEILSTFALPSGGGAGNSSVDSIDTQNAVQNQHSNAETTRSVNEGDMTHDRDDYPRGQQDRPEELNEGYEPQQRYVRDLLEFEEEMQHQPQNLYIAFMDLVAPVLETDEKDVVSVSAKRVMNSALLDIQSALPGEHGNSSGVTNRRDAFHIKALLPFVKRAKSAITNPIEVLMSLQRLNSKLAEPLPLEDMQESVPDEGKLDQDLDQDQDHSYDDAHKSDQHRDILRTQNDHSRPAPVLELVMPTPEAGESGSSQGNPSVTSKGGTESYRIPGDIRSWIKADDQSKLLAKIAAERTPGTGEWISQLPSYLNLKHGRLSFLLLEGLRHSAIFQDLRHRSTGCAFYSFQEYRHEVSVKPSVKSLIGQLVEQAHEDKIKLPNALAYKLHKEMEDPLHGLTGLLSVLQTTFTLFQETFIILDGLEKCSSGVLKTLSRIAQTAVQLKNNARIIATSRFNLNVEDAIREEQLDRPTRAEFQWHNNYQAAIIPRKVVMTDVEKTLASLDRVAHTWSPRNRIAAESQGM
ncbi:MAG: hypothetical protein Q9213_006383 [Squamulea squamosa]